MMIRIIISSVSIFFIAGLYHGSVPFYASQMFEANDDSSATLIQVAANRGYSPAVLAYGRNLITAENSGAQSEGVLLLESIDDFESEKIEANFVLGEYFKERNRYKTAWDYYYRNIESSHIASVEQLLAIEDKIERGPSGRRNDAYIFQFTEILANKGNEKAQLSMSKLLLDRFSDNHNPAEATKWLLKLIEKNNIPAMLLLADAYDDGDIASNNGSVEARKLYKQAAKLGSVEAYESLIIELKSAGEYTAMFESLIDKVESGLGKASDYYTLAAGYMTDDSDWMSDEYDRKGSSGPDAEKVQYWMKEGLKHGCQYCAFYLIEQERNGKPYLNDKQREFSLFKQAAEFEAGYNHKTLQYTLGLFYEKGWGTDQNTELAMNHYKKSKNSSAYFRLAHMMETGLLGEQNDYKLCQLYVKSYKASRSYEGYIATNFKKLMLSDYVSIFKRLENKNPLCKMISQQSLDSIRKTQEYRRRRNNSI